jgi:hypothetical protein
VAPIPIPILAVDVRPVDDAPDCDGRLSRRVDVAVFDGDVILDVGVLDAAVEVILVGVDVDVDVEIIPSFVETIALSLV